VSQGSSFVGSVDAATRRGLLELDRRLAGVQATIAALSPAHSDLSGLGADDHLQYLTEARGDVRYAAVGASPTITLAGDASGAVTLTDLGSGTLTVTVADDSHNHTIANVDNLQTTLNGKAASAHTHSYLPLSGGTLTGTVYVGNGTSSIDVLTIRNEIQAGDGSSTDPSYTFSSDGDCGMYRVSTNAVGITAGGTVAQFKTDGLHLADGDWFRSYGTTGWYNGTYGGGINMTDSEFVKVYNSKAFEINRWGGRNYDDSTLYLNTAQGGTANIGFHPGGQAPQIRAAYNDNSFYFRNYPDTGWAGVHGIIYNQSSRRYKQDISDFANHPSTLSGAADTSQARSGLEIVRALRPRHYRWNWEQQMRQLPLNGRRADALRRLNRYRRKNGLPEFTSDETWHQCGRDCDGTQEEPCWRYKDWESGYFGFIAEEVGEVAPEAGRPDPGTGELSALDSLAISAIIVAALKEVDERVSKLEGAST
jgi:hypothetical protein